MKLFKEFIREQRVTKSGNVRESVITPSKAFIFDQNRGYEELDGPKDNYVLVGTVCGKLSELFNLLYKLINKYDTILMTDVIFCDAGGSKIQIWVDKDTIDELKHAGGDIEEYAEMRAADMIDEATSMVVDLSYEKVWNILNTFEAANKVGQTWYDFEHAFWEEIENFYAYDGGDFTGFSIINKK